MHVSTVSTCGIPWILQKLLFSHTSFWWEGFLNISNHSADSSFGSYCIDSVNITNSIEITQIKQFIMPKPVFLMTVQEAHREYNSLTDKIRAKYEQLDSGKFGSPGTPAFDAEACELANLLACVSQLCQKLNLPTPKELYRPTFFKH